MRYFLILNPGAKGGASARKFEKIHALFEGRDYDFGVTATLDDAYALSKKANLAAYDAIVAVGGDGTVNRVLNGFYDDNGKRHGTANFGVIYTGTSPDFCKSYGIPLDTEKAVRTILNGETREIGVGRIQFADGAKYFACCANIGLGADLANRANGGIRKKWGDSLGTFFALLQTLRACRPIDVTVNGETVTHLYNLSVGKTYYVASGLKIAHALAPDDERFYVLPVCGKPFSHMRKLYGGKPLPLSYAREIQIEGTGKVEFDGDEGGRLPCVVTGAERLGVYYEGKGNH